MEQPHYTDKTFLKAFEFYEGGKPLMIIYAPDCWQALALLQQHLQKPFYYNPVFRQLKTQNSKL